MLFLPNFQKPHCFPLFLKLRLPPLDKIIPNRYNKNIPIRDIIGCKITLLEENMKKHLLSLGAFVLTLCLLLTSCSLFHTHSWDEGVITTKVTCTTTGVTTYTCTGCGETKTEEIAATGKHNYTSKITTEATCTKAGVKTYTCSTCGDSYKETIPSAHKWVAATCTTPKTCSVCKATEGKALGHTTSTGVCSRCGYSFKLSSYEIATLCDYALKVSSNATSANNYALQAYMSIGGSSLQITMYYTYVALYVVDVANDLSKMSSLLNGKAEITLTKSSKNYNTLSEEIYYMVCLCSEIGEICNSNATFANTSKLSDATTNLMSECSNLMNNLSYI